MDRTASTNEGAALPGAGRSTPEPPPWSPLTELSSPAPFRPSSPWVPSEPDPIITTIPSPVPCSFGYLSLLVEAAEMTRKRGRAPDLSTPEVPEKQPSFRVDTPIGPREIWYGSRKIRRMKDEKEKASDDHALTAGMTVLEKLRLGLGKRRTVGPQVAGDKHFGLSCGLENDQDVAPEMVLSQVAPRLEHKATYNKKAKHLGDRTIFV